MDRDQIVARIRAQAGSLQFDTPTGGALALAKLRYDLPASEMLPGIEHPQIVREIIRKTIVHSHRASGGLTPDGRGFFASFSRHVSTDDGRWDFEVEVDIDAAGNAAISRVHVVRPGDDEADPDDPESTPRAELRPPLTDADLLPHGMIACPCCGHATLKGRGRFDICPICFWEDDGQDGAELDEYRGGPNRVSLAEGRKNFLAIGASDEKDLPHVRRPTREEVRLRHFDAKGRELPR
jgi:hypothetical protein